MIFPRVVRAVFLLMWLPGAASAAPEVHCVYPTGQTAILTFTSAHQNELTLLSLHGVRDVSLIRLDGAGDIAEIETNGGLVKQEQVARVWRVLRGRIGNKQSATSCGIPWRLSPE